MPKTGAATGEADRNRFYIAAPSQVMERRPRVLKAGNTFGVFDLKGDLHSREHGAEGLYHEDTRYLSELNLAVAGGSLMLLASTIVTGEGSLDADLTNPDIFRGDEIVVPRETLHLFRSKTLKPGFCRELLRFRNYGEVRIAVPAAFTFAADFADIFEVRGQKRARRGEMLPEQKRADGGVVLGYRGLDGIERRTTVRFHPAPNMSASGVVHYQIALDPHEELEIVVEVECESSALAGIDGEPDVAPAVDQPRDLAAPTRIESTSVPFDEWIARSRSDVAMLTTLTPYGPYPYAGIPWFSTAFGRDAIITALECLWLDPALAKGVLAFLAANQAQKLDPSKDAEPGKILHETRQGEMARLGEVPFRRYYGSVDSTPLFVMLAGAYWERTGDTDFIRTIWPNVEAALEWMRKYGDIDGDGFIEYGRTSPNGLINQGWKDSNDSIFHLDGRLAEAPIALCEVQGYAYAAKLAAGTLARALGDLTRSTTLIAEAIMLRDKFEAAFWCEEIGTYALALDGKKQPCRVRSSNAGHTLLCGLASPERARRVAEALMDERGFSGWGIRTIANGEARYNPMSYHDGSVWPHDNAMIAVGFARYDLKEPLLRLTEGLFDATRFLDLQRLPELFCGFERRPQVGPTSYPVACIPQAWSSAAAFALIGACLGISIDATTRQIRFTRPVLPSFLHEMSLRDLRLGDASVDVKFRRYDTEVAVTVVRRSGDVEVIVRH
ncbi:MAG TPA: amylo-alpha-1,6-glucosidase [Stellaceae bacterium]